MRLMTLEEITTWIEHHGQILIIFGGSILGLILSAMLWRRIRHSSVAKVGQFVAGPLVLAWEAQGVFQVGHQLLGLPWPVAGVGSVVTAAVLITLGAQAHEHWQRHGVLGPNGRLMLIVAVPMGMIIALSAHSPVEVGLRIVLPLLAYIVFRSRYMPDEPPGADRKRGSWIWTPRRIGVHLGLIDPTDADITTVHYERQIRLLVKLSRKAHGGGLLHRWHAARLQRHAELADPAMMAEVVRRRTQADFAMVLTDPDTTPQRLLEIAHNIDARRRAVAPSGRPDALPSGTPARTDVVIEAHIVPDASGYPAPDVPVPVRTPARAPLPHTVPLTRSRPDGGAPGRPDAPPYVASRVPSRRPAAPAKSSLAVEKDRTELARIATTYPDMSWDQMREALRAAGRLKPSQSEMEEATRIRRPRIKQLLLDPDNPRLAESYYPNAYADVLGELDRELEQFGEEEVPTP